jgi:hypothetical protein
MLHVRATGMEEEEDEKIRRPKAAELEANATTLQCFANKREIG